MWKCMTHQLGEIFFQFFILKNFSQFFVLKKALDEIKNINPTFIPILLWHLQSIRGYHKNSIDFRSNDIQWLRKMQ